MADQPGAEAGCRLVGEYVDEAEEPTTPAARGEVVRPQVVADHLDLWGLADGIKEFTVLLTDGRVVAVRGHALKQLPPAGGDGGSYGVVVRTASAEELVALFRIADVVGIFHGELRPDRKTA
jgi:hypothetical protein